jgi:1-deoxy-D-xylulose-5-phosphate reductoisomerase
LAATAQLTFFHADFAKFPCLGLAYEALARGGTCPAVLNAVNEVSVESFLSGQIRFTDIAELNSRVLAAHTPQPVMNLEVLLEADRWARSQAYTALGLGQQRAAIAT